MKLVRISLIILSLGMMGFFPTFSQGLKVEPKLELSGGGTDSNKTNLCRCKSGGCYGGNLISFRARCGQGTCSDGEANCPR